jgi:hypothetical protein
MPTAMARNLESPERRLLADLAALDRLTREEGPTALKRLEAALGPERAQFLVRALTGEGRSRRADAIPPAASA